MITRRSLGIRGVLPAALLAAAALSGCYQPGGPYWSADTHTYWSTTWAPKTVSLLDTRTGETIWTAEVPVDKQLVMQFVEDRGRGGELPDLMQWEIMDRGRNFGSLSNQTPVPAKHRRRVDLALRPAPEAPDEAMDAAPPVRDLDTGDEPPDLGAATMSTKQPPDGDSTSEN